MEATTLGRLRQAKVNEIKRLWEKGYTLVEISEKTRVARSTISGYIKQWEKTAPTPPPPSTNALAKAFFNLLSVWAVAPYLDEGSVGELIDDLAFDLFSQLAGSTPDVKTLIAGNPYLSLLRQDVLDLQVPNDKLAPELLERRQKWLGLLKKFPESLKELV